MSQTTTSNTECDPVDPAVLAAAVRVWLATDPEDHEADVALECALLEQGVLSLLDVVAGVSFEADEDLVLRIGLADGTWLDVEARDGRVRV